MSEGFELEGFHVPQQSRRDKLRETASGGLVLPLYDPSLIPSAMLTCNAAADMQQQAAAALIKEEGMNFMGFSGGAANGFVSPHSSAAVASSSSQLLLDLTQSSVVAANPSYSPEEINSASNPFLYASQIPFDPFRGGGGLAFKPPHPLSYQDASSSSTPQGLSLSLSSHYRNRHDASGTTAAAFGNKDVGNYVAGGVPGCESMMTNSVPIGPFTGYTTILKESKFLRPAQQLLEEICDVGRGYYIDQCSGECSSSLEMESLSESEMVEDGGSVDGLGDRSERRRTKARLISMLNEVYKRYKQYCQQLQDVIASFQLVDGLGMASPYTSLALKMMSKHFRSLKNAITDQLRSTSRNLSEESLCKVENQSFGFLDQSFRQQKASYTPTIHEQQQIWRPQRGLPERAVAVLRAWLFEHFLHPYPTDSDKQMLAKQTGLSRNQVSNWFINARVRLWKPMVEEIHTLEMRQAQKASEGSSNSTKDPSRAAFTPSVAPCDKHLSKNTAQKDQDPPPKRYRDDYSHLPNSCDDPMGYSYGNFSGHHQSGISLAHGSGGGISLTLGLHQNNGGLSEPLPVAIGQFGLVENSNSYVMGDFQSQDRHHLGRDISGQLLHDFVG